jgi:general secretion pathway protein F
MVVVKRAITMSLDRKDRERELSSKLLSSLFGAGVLNSDQVGKGFTRLFEPLLMMVIGLLIGGIVVLMYMPIFDLAGSLQ